jgi:tetratricopeptide (TPR) repeat protein
LKNAGPVRKIGIFALVAQALTFRSALFAAIIWIVAGNVLGQTTAREFCNRGVARQKKGDLDGAIADYSRAIELNPQNALAYNNRGLVKIAKGDLEGALGDYDRALQINPRNFEIRTNRGVARQKAGDTDGATKDYDIAIKLYHKYALAYSNRANLKLAQNDVDGALEDCNRALDYNSKDAGAYNTRALIERTKGDLDAATADFGRAIKLDPKYARNSPPLVKPLATPPPSAVATAQPNPAKPADQAIASAAQNPIPGSSPKVSDTPKRADLRERTDVSAARPQPDYAPPIEVEPRNIAAAYDRDVSKRKKNDLNGAVANATPAVDQTATIAVPSGVGTVEKKTSVAAAPPALTPTVELPAKNPETSTSLELAKSKPTEMAVVMPTATPAIETKKLHVDAAVTGATPATELSSMAAANTTAPESAKPSVTLNLPASEQTRTGQGVAVVDHNREMEPQKSPPTESASLTTERQSLSASVPARTPAEPDPTSPVGYERRAEFRKAIGDLSGALMDFTRAIQLDPKYAPAYNGRANIRRAKHDLTGALADYNRAIELNGSNPVAYYNRGLIKENRGDFDGALADLNPAIQLDPKNAAAYHTRAAVKSMKGDVDGALADYNRAIELDPKDAATYNNRADLHFAARNWDAALDDYSHFFELSKEGRDYPHLYVWLIRARTGQMDAANKALADYLEARGNAGDWRSTIAAYLLDRVSDGDLFAAAKSPDKNKETGQLCEAWFYVGMKKLISGDKDSARSCFNKSVATEQKNYTEYQFARAELKALPK